MPYPLVQPPAPIDPMRSLSEIMALANASGQMQERQQLAPLNKQKIAADTAELQSTTAERNAATAQKLQATADQKTIDTILSQGGDQDSIIQHLRDAGQAHLIPSVQKTFDDAATRKATLDKTIAETSKDNADAADTNRKVLDAKNDYLGGLGAAVAEHGYTPDAFAHAVALAHNDKVLDPVSAGRLIATAIQDPKQIQPMVDAQIAASPEQRKNMAERNKIPTSFAGAILQARAKGDTAGVQSLTQLAGHVSAAERDPGTPVTGDMIDAVSKNPMVWSDLTPGVRDKMIAPLSKRGFDFSQARDALTPAKKAQIEEWKQRELDGEEKAFSAAIKNANLLPDDAIPKELVDAHNARKAGIQDSYLIQLGLPPATAAARPAPGAPTVPPAGNQPPAAAAPKAAAAPATKRTASKADVGKVAARLGISTDAAQKQLEAAGVTIGN